MSSNSMQAYIKSLPSVSFKNKHGEKFVIRSDGISVLMSGDEVDMMVEDKYKVNGCIPLFNKHFSIWSNDELLELGKALQKLSQLQSKRS